MLSERGFYECNFIAFIFILESFYLSLLLECFLQSLNVIQNIKLQSYSVVKVDGISMETNYQASFCFTMKAKITQHLALKVYKAFERKPE